MQIGKTVLVVDDEAPVRDALARVLSRQRYAVVSVADGRQARHYASENSPDFAILDVDLANEENGWELAEQLLAVHPALPIVMITANPDPPTHPLASAVDGVMEKPLEMDVLVERIAHVLASPSDDASGYQRVTARTNNTLSQGRG